MEQDDYIPLDPSVLRPGEQNPYHSRPPGSRPRTQGAGDNQWESVHSGGTQCTQSTQSTQVNSGFSSEEDESDASTVLTDSQEGSSAGDVHVEAQNRARGLLADLRRRDGKHPKWRIPFELARALKSLPAESPVVFENVAIEFFQNLGIDPFEAWVSFLRCWGLVRNPAGMDAWDQAVEAAKARPLAIRPEPGRLLAPLASVAAYLDAACPGEPFVFSLPRIVKSFGLSPMGASRAVKILMNLGILELVDGDWLYTEGKARTFRFVSSVTETNEGYSTC